MLLVSLSSPLSFFYQTLQIDLIHIELLPPVFINVPFDAAFNLSHSQSLLVLEVLSLPIEILDYLVSLLVLLLLVSEEDVLLQQVMTQLSLLTLGLNSVLLLQECLQF